MSDEVMSDRCVTILETVGRTKRNSQDSVVNSFGNKLLDICGKFDICILNGRTLGDLCGNFTSFQRMGRSVVDYFITSEHLVPHIHTLQVSPPNNVSDHAFVAMNLYCNRKCNQPSSLESIINKRSKFVKQFCWKPDSGEKFCRALGTPLLQQYIQKFISNEYGNHDINQCCEDLNNIFQKAASLSLKLKSKGRRGHKNEKLGFDNECRT